MSKENALKFFSYAEKDGEIAERLRAAAGSEQEFCERSAAIGREKGFSFEAAHVKEVLAELSAFSAELTDEQLGAVAGGAGFGTVAMTLGCLTEGTRGGVTGTCRPSGTVRLVSLNCGGFTGGPQGEL